MNVVTVTFGLLTLASAMINVHLNSRAHKQSVVGMVVFLLLAVGSAASVAAAICGG
jgi:hypothetical protein